MIDRNKPRRLRFALLGLMTSSMAGWPSYSPGSPLWGWSSHRDDDDPGVHR